MEEFIKYVGEPLSKVKTELESMGKTVTVKKNSLPKIQTDCELVVHVRRLSVNEVELVVGDFLINIENKIN